MAHRYRLHAAVLAVALVARLWNLASIAGSSPLFASPVVDAHTYTTQARLIAAGAWLDYTSGPFWQPPLYPWFLGAVCRLWPDDLFLAARLLHALLGALSCTLLYVAGRRLGGDACGLTAGLALALYGPAIYFDGQLLPTTLGLLLPLVLYLAVPDDAGSPRRWLGVGGILGLASICVPTALVLTPCLVLWLLSRRVDGGGMARAGRLLALTSGVLLVVSPVGARNLFLGGDAVMISWNGGVNFYLGNNPDYPATTRIRPGQPWLDLMGHAAAAGQASGSANSRFFYGRSLEFILQDPGTWMSHASDKVWRLLHGEEIGRNQSPYWERQHSAVLAGLLWRQPVYVPFGLVAPLALLGIVVSLSRPGRPRLVAGFLVAYGTGVVLFFVVARYRMPLVPYALLAAVLAGQALWQATRARRRLALGGWAGLAGLGVALNTGSVDAGTDWGREALFALGQAHVDRGEFKAAVTVLQRAAQGAPDDVDVLFSLGTAYLMGDDAQRAVPPLERVTALRPERVDARLNLGNALFGVGRYAEASEQYEAGLRLRPGDAVLTRGAARAMARSGALAAAIGHYRRWHRAMPDDLEPCLALGYAYVRTAVPDSALHFYERALQLEPTHLTAMLETALLHLKAGRSSVAARFVSRAAHLYPAVPRVDSVRAVVAQRLGQHPATDQ